MENQMRCPACKSDKLEFQKGWHMEKMSKETGRAKDGPEYAAHKYLCLDCGLFFEIMPKESLNEYNRD